MRISLLLEDSLAAAALIAALGLALLPLHIDERPARPQQIYSTSFLKFPPVAPVLEMSRPLDCDATVKGRSPGEVARERCYVRQSRRGK